MSIADLRQDYTRAGLQESDLDPDPIRQFQVWFDQATQAGLIEPNAMTLATATPQGHPSARTMLLKGVDQRGFSFFTNYESRKGSELAANPHAAMVFLWLPLERQVCVQGRVERLPLQESEAYFRSRPRGNRLGACASDQSRVIAGRAELEERLRQLESAYPGGEIPKPEHWGGYVLIPHRIEFWQGRPNRLHDRLCYFRESGPHWVIRRLAP